MNFWILIILGIIQGLTEFLPVSSSGHLVLLYEIFGIEMSTVMLSILLHLATLLSVLIYYRKEIIELIKHPLCSTNKKIIVTTIITCAMVLLIKPIVDFGFNGDYLFIFFLITAILLFVSDYMAERHSIMSRTINYVSNTKSLIKSNITDIDISYKQAIIIGITQGVACIPGISRSGSTIAVARICGADKDSATYSFLISIPIIIASLVLEIFEGGSLAGVNIWGLIISLVLCFIVGLLCIKAMTNFVRKSKLSYFAYYLIILSAFLILNDMCLHWF